MKYNVINLDDINNAIGTNKLEKILFDFDSLYNNDVNIFLKNKAVLFSKQGIAKTFLVTTSFQKKEVVVGYFSLATKTTIIRKSSFSKTKLKRIKKFSTFEDNRYIHIPLPLIGQISKNFKNNYNSLINGNQLLKLALDKIVEAQKILGGKYAFLECEDTPRLIEFYESNGFVTFGKRNLEKDEKDDHKSKYLLQMLCDLS